MGVVYSALDIECETFPAEGDHERAAGSVLAVVPALPGVDTTMVYGSVAEGRSNLRSDLDVLVTYSAEGTAEAVLRRLVVKQLDEVERHTGVRVEANIWPTSEPLALRTARINDLLFAGYLARHMNLTDEWRIGSPDVVTMRVAEGLRSASEREIAQIVLKYAAAKHRRFMRAPLQYEDDPRVLSAMQRALELPKAIGRKIVQLKDMPSARQTQPELIDTLLESGLDDATADAIDVLSGLDRECTDLIEGIDDSGDISPSDKIRYQSWLRESYPGVIDSGIVAASGFTRFVAERYL